MTFPCAAGQDTVDLKAELARKDELIKKTQDKIAFWKSTLAEVQHPRGPAELPPQLQDGQVRPLSRGRAGQWTRYEEDSGLNMGDSGLDMERGLDNKDMGWERTVDWI